jgi:hypothetical protein
MIAKGTDAAVRSMDADGADVLPWELPVWVKRFEVAVLEEEFPGSLALIGAR